MDEIDVAICLMLMGNSRIAYRKIAEMFKISVNSIHKRVKALVNQGIISKFTAKIHVNAFLPDNVIIFGTVKTKNLDETIQEIGLNECVYNISATGNNTIFVHALIRNLSEYEKTVAQIKKISANEEMLVGIQEAEHGTGLMDKQYYKIAENVEEIGIKSFSDLDYLIIDALKDNARIPIPEIAEQLNKSAKTVRRRLNQMMENFLIDLSIDWNPGSIISILDLQFHPDHSENKIEVVNQLREKFGHKIIYQWVFSNLPNNMLILVWTLSIVDLHAIEANLPKEKLESAKVSMLYKGGNFLCWRDSYLEEMVKKIRNSS